MLSLEEYSKDNLCLDPANFCRVLDKGFVRYVDHMGGDHSVVNAARVSYQKGTTKVRDDDTLIDYLVRNEHTSPSEMVEITFHVKMPIFVARQWVRHRTACLQEDTLINFDLPGKYNSKKIRAYNLKIKDIYKKWQPTSNKRKDKQRNSFFKRDRVKNMRLRSLNEKTGEIYHTHIKDVFYSGKKEVYEVEFDDKTKIQSTLDHKYFTNLGWLPLKDALNKGAVFAAIGTKGRKSNRKEIDLQQLEKLDQIWKDIPNFKGKYQVSNLGLVRSLVNTRNKIILPKIKKQTISNGYYCVSLSERGVSRVYYVHNLVLSVFNSPAPQYLECRHIDGNSLNNNFNNLKWGTRQQNAFDKVSHGTQSQLTLVWKAFNKITYIGEKDTYDLEVDGPYHNFSANKLLVHNSMNEISARYSEMPDEFYFPENWRKQSNRNKQVSEENFPKSRTDYFNEDAYHRCDSSYNLYKEYLKNGVGREQARMVLPLNLYTEFYWKCNARNLSHFLHLRSDSHAQWEIRQYTFPMKVIFKAIAPSLYSAYTKHVWNVVKVPISQSILEDLQKITDASPDTLALKKLLEKGLLNV